MDSNAELVEHLKRAGVLKTPDLIEAFVSIDRADFVTKEFKDDPYGDHPLSIGYGQTISQPYTVAFMLELLRPQAGEKILDVGSGSGWTSALLAHVAGPGGRVFAAERIPELTEFAQNNVSKYDFKNLEFRKAEKDILGLPDEAPFDRILVSASAVKIPDELINQLKEGGVMVIPVLNSVFKIVKKRDGDISEEEHPGFVFVPLL